MHYWASPIEARLCGGQEVALVGAGNSAGQAAVYLASHAKKVWLLARGDSLEASMSRYLVERIKAQPNIEVLTETEVTALEGDEGNLESVRWRNRASGEETTRPIRHLFLFIGADPNTDWLAQCDVALDAKGFVRTGRDCGERASPAGDQPHRRVRHRRRALRFGQARRRRRRRRRPGGRCASCLSRANRQRAPPRLSAIGRP